MIDNLKIYLLDILSVFVPGAALFAVLSLIPSVCEFFEQYNLFVYEGWVNISRFLILIYILGHLLFFISSYLDDYLYDPLKYKFFKEKGLQILVSEYKIAKTGIEDGNILNAFKWSCSWLLAHHPSLYANMERHMAESKFFRSMIPVGILALFVYSLNNDISGIILSIIAIVIFLFGYFKQRKKSLDVAYQGVITTSGENFQNYPKKRDMFRSKEIRWIKDDLERDILDWFAKQGQTFDNTKPRTDFYLPLLKEDITVKLREGNIEIKERITPPCKGKLTKKAIGHFEEYVKWSFKTDQADSLSSEISQQGKHGWIATKKRRMGIKITLDKDGLQNFVPISDQIPFGCQVEYTELTVKEKIYYTFALEWFEKLDMKIEDKFLQEILNNSKLKLADSMGYARFLNKKGNG